MRKHVTILTAAALAVSVSTVAYAGNNTNGTSVSATVSLNADSRTADRIYDVRARGNRNDSRREVYNEALYKAAKKTRKEDYDWFRVIESHVEREVRVDDNRGGFETSYERVPYRSCGLLTCRTEYRTERRSDLRIDFDDREETRFTVELDFEMGWGELPGTGEVYDARQAKRDFK